MSEEPIVPIPSDPTPAPPQHLKLTQVRWFAHTKHTLI